jgi:nitrate/nitrite transport system permease protein
MSATMLEPVLVESAPTTPPTARPPKHSRARELLTASAFRVLGLIVFLGIWWLIAWRAPDLPSPSQTWSEFTDLAANALTTSDANGNGIGLQLGDSLVRAFKGFALAAIVGIPFGLLIGASRRAWQAANPVIQLLRPVSPLAWFPLGLVVLKNSPDAAVFAIFITSVWAIVLNTAAGASSVPADQRNVARVFRFRRSAYLRQILIPHTMPSIVTGLRLSMGTAWMVIVAAEMLSGNNGIGFFVWNSYNGGNLAAVISAIALIGLVGVALDAMFVALGRRYEGATAR